MRRYNVIINRVRKIIVTVNQFPRDKTLTFFHHSSIRLLAKIIIKMYIEAQFINTLSFEIIDNFVKLQLLLRNKVQDIKLSIMAIPSSIEKENLTTSIKFVLNWGLSQLVSFEFFDSFTFKMLLEPIVGRFRKLGEMDEIELGHWDDMTLGDVDFIVM